MLRWSFPLGRIMGVDVRMHLVFPLLFVAALAFSVQTTGQAVRGVGLFAALLFAIFVREAARTIAAAYSGFCLRVLFLLPVGGVMGFAPEANASPESSRALLFAAPIANIVIGLLLLGLAYGVAPGVDLLRQPWISAHHVLRAFVWMQFLIALVNLLPAASLPARRAPRPEGAADSPPAGAPFSSGTGRNTASTAAFSLTSGLAVALILAGLLTANFMPAILGFFLLLYTQLRVLTAGPAVAATGEAIRADDVMTVDFISVSSSDTLRSALERTVGTAQEVFPVLRGDRLVGSISRQTLTDNLQTDGDGYVQGAMRRTVATTRAGETLAATFARSNVSGTTECVAVVDGFEGPNGGRVLGILTMQSVQRAVQQVRLIRLRSENCRTKP